jgi:hypothetical protein
MRGAVTASLPPIHACDPVPEELSNRFKGRRTSSSEPFPGRYSKLFRVLFAMSCPVLTEQIGLVRFVFGDRGNKVGDVDEMPPV